MIRGPGLLEALAKAPKCPYCVVKREFLGEDKVRDTYIFCRQHEPPFGTIYPLHIEIDSFDTEHACVTIQFTPSKKGET